MGVGCAYGNVVYSIYLNYFCSLPIPPPTPKKPVKIPASLPTPEDKNKPQGNQESINK